MPASLQHGGLSVVLVNTRNPLNIGAAARAMSNFGFSDLRLVNPYDPSFREARSALGASAMLTAACEYTSLAEAVADCAFVVGTTSGARRKLRQPLERLETAAARIGKELRRGNVAMLFGSEKRGLSNADLSHCHLLLRIPTREEHGSMNLGQAVAVCLYELARPGRSESRRELPAHKTGAKTRPASGDLERVTGLLAEALRLSGYTDPGRADSIEEEVRRMVRRLNLSDADAEAWLGMLRQMVWKLRAQRQEESPV